MDQVHLFTKPATSSVSLLNKTFWQLFGSLGSNSRAQYINSNQEWDLQGTLEDQRKKKSVEWRGEKSGISAESEANIEDRAILVAWRNWCFFPLPSYCLQYLPWGSVYVKAQPGSLTYTARTHSSKNGERKSSCDHGPWEGKAKSQEFDVFLCNRVSRRLGNNRLHLKIMHEFNHSASI